MKIPSLVAALLLLPAIAEAGVLYQWQALNHEAPYGITLQLEFDQETVGSGGFSFHLSPEESHLPRPDSGLLALRYSFPGAITPMAYYPALGGFGGGYGTLDMEVSFAPGGFLSGYIYANNNDHHFIMRSDQITFTVLDANSDQGMPGCGSGDQVPCSGATGHIRQVPEPGSLALLGLGLLAAAGMRRGGKRR